MALRLHAIVPADGQNSDLAPDGAAGGGGTKVIPFRDLGAVVSDQRQFALEESQPADVEAHRTVVDALFQRGAVLPAPVGVLFRASDVLIRWMELHYVALSDALEFVEDRAVGRVHIERVGGKADDKEAGADLAAAAADAFRALRRRSVAAVPLRLEKVTGLMLSAAFLVERELWKEFVEAVDEQQGAHPTLRLELTGPWAPYDFVRMQFGG